LAIAHSRSTVAVDTPSASAAYPVDRAAGAEDRISTVETAKSVSE
jgi:hypothetical protein